MLVVKRLFNLKIWKRYINQTKLSQGIGPQRTRSGDAERVFYFFTNRLSHIPPLGTPPSQIKLAGYHPTSTTAYATPEPNLESHLDALPYDEVKYPIQHPEVADAEPKQR